MCVYVYIHIYTHIRIHIHIHPMKMACSGRTCNVSDSSSADRARPERLNRHPSRGELLHRDFPDQNLSGCDFLGVHRFWGVSNSLIDHFIKYFIN